MATFVALIAVTTAAILFKILLPLPRFMLLVDVVYIGVSAITDPELNDQNKERIVRSSGLKLFNRTLDIFLRLSFCFLGSWFVVVFADYSGICPLSKSLENLSSVELIAFSVIIFFILSKTIKSSSTIHESKDNYNSAEKIFHSLVFCSNNFQKLVCILDDFVYTRFIREDLKSRKVIFLTSLARGGTTALLNTLSSIDSIATHTYKDMPFITAPYLWSKLGGLFRTEIIKKNRAHGDGLKIDLKSPEAFEEVYWKLYWPHKYLSKSIETWRQEDSNPEAVAKLQLSFEKIVSLRSPKAKHYLSKNNHNIGRLKFIRKNFPSSHVFVLVRQPAPHAASLLRQHLNFLELQKKDPFIKSYMRDIGHFEFGLNHKPINFEDFYPQDFDPLLPDYWLAYWVAAFKNVLNNLDSCHLVFHDDYRHNPNKCIGDMLNFLAIDCSGRDFSGGVNNITDETDVSKFSPALLEESENIYSELRSSTKQSDF